MSLQNSRLKTIYVKTLKDSSAKGPKISSHLTKIDVKVQFFVECNSVQDLARISFIGNKEQITNYNGGHLGFSRTRPYGVRINMCNSILIMKPYVENIWNIFSKIIIRIISCMVQWI